MNNIKETFGPVFFVGNGRSGTTIMFEALAQHKDLAWPSNYCKWMPASLYINALVPILDRIGLRGNKKQYGKVLPGNRFLPQPDEAYEFWDYYTQQNFSRSYLHDLEASEQDIKRIRNAVYSLMRWQGKSRFAAKLTGPGRISYLAGVFPDARFIHVIRDGRSVVESLLRQKFWIEKGGLEAPFWDDTPETILDEWKASGNNSDILAAVQWRHVIESIQSDVSRLPNISYMEVRYEDFVNDPIEKLKSIYQFAGLSIPEKLLKSNESDGSTLKNMNEKWRGFDEVRLQRMTKVMQPVLGELGYE